MNQLQIVPSRIAGFKEELGALTCALSRTSQTAEALENYGDTGLSLDHNLVDGITFELARNGKKAGERRLAHTSAA